MSYVCLSVMLMRPVLHLHILNMQNDLVCLTDRIVSVYVQDDILNACTASVTGCDLDSLPYSVLDCTAQHSIKHL